MPLSLFRRSAVGFCSLTLGFLLIGGVSLNARAGLWPETEDRLKAELASPDAGRRRVAVESTLGLAKDQAAPLLAKAVLDVDVDVRLAAAGVASRRAIDVGDVLLQWLTDSDARLREGACDYFSRLPQPRVVKVLARALGDSDPRVRLAAVRALGASEAVEAVAPLLARLDDGNSKVRLSVSRALGKLGDKRAVTPLVSKIQDEAPEVRQAVVRTLGELGDTKASPALAIALRDKALEVRIEALFALGRLRSTDAVASIAPLALDPSTANQEVRRAALSALGRIGSRGAVEVIVRAFGVAEDERDRLPSGQFGSSPARDAAIVAGVLATPVLLTILRDGPVVPTAVLTTKSLPPARTDIAASAAYVLGSLRVVGSAEAIVRATRRGMMPLKVGLHAVGLAQDDGQLPFCLEYVTADDSGDRDAALRATALLLNPDRPDGRAVEPLLASLDRASTNETRAEIALLLGRTGAVRVAPRLIGLAASKDHNIRRATAEGLGMLRASSAGPTLLTLLEDPSGEVRLAAAVALGRAGGRDVLGSLLERLTSRAETDRFAWALATATLLARHGQDEDLVKLRAILPLAGPERDLLLGGLARSSAPTAIHHMRELVALGDVDTRRAIAGAAGAHVQPARAVLLRTLADDLDPSVRAQAVFGLGFVGDATDVPRLVVALTSPYMPIAANAAAALGGISMRMDVPLNSLCTALTSEQIYLRANALTALNLALQSGREATCEPALERKLLSSDSNEPVRRAAAGLLVTRLAKAKKKELTAPAAGELSDVATRSALERCAGADPSREVAAVCGLANVRERAGSEQIVVLVTAEDSSVPAPRTPYALERPDGLLHLGVSDRRGAVLELAIPHGVLRLRPASPG